MTYRLDSNLTWIVIHYSATPIEKDFTAADIDKMHKARGFKEIGYHYFIRKDGTVEHGRDMDTPGRFEQGAHSQGENASSIGICYEGGVRASAPNKGFDSRTPAQIKAMTDLLHKLTTRYPNAIVEGHRDMPGAATQCPGFDAGAWWHDVLAGKKPRNSKAQSTTLQAAGLSGVGVVGAAGTAIGALDGTVQLIVVAGAVVAVLGLLWIARERVRKWAAGDR